MNQIGTGLSGRAEIMHSHAFFHLDDIQEDFMDLLPFKLALEGEVGFAPREMRWTGTSVDVGTGGRHWSWYA